MINKTTRTKTLSENNAGFTLIELSVVLVIIGLIIGGVLTGQQLIQNARVTNALNGIQAYQAQFQTYMQNYGAAPGDDIAATTRFPNAGVVSNGDGDGTIQGVAFETATVTESRLVWSHLRAAGLVRNQETSGGSNAIQPANPFNGNYGFQDGAFKDGFTTTVLCLDKVPAAAARDLDSRLDDGKPGSGSLRSGTATDDKTATVADYSGGGELIVCVRM